MACSVTINGLPRDCEANVGGIKALYIANKDDVSAITLAESGGMISGITMASGAKFKSFYFKRGMASVTLTPQFNDAGEYVGEDGVLSVSFGKMDTTKRVQIAALSVAEMVVIYTDNNGISWLLGYDNPVLRNGGDAVTGASSTDRNQYALDLHSADNQLPYEVAGTLIETIVG